MRDPASSALVGLRKPTIGIADCCARAASGHAATPLINVMNSRRLIAAPETSDRGIVAAQMRAVKGWPMSALGQKHTSTLLIDTEIVRVQIILGSKIERHWFCSRDARSVVAPMSSLTDR
jgi:hypothetical protein